MSNPVRAAALVGLNPLLVVYGVGGGHNDLLMLLAAVGAPVRDADPAGAASAADSACSPIGIKLTAGLLLPFAIAAGGPTAPPRPAARAGARRRASFWR